MESLIFKFLHVTESTAKSVEPFIGSGDKIAADQAAVKTLRTLLNDIDMDGTIKIGEGEIDEAPMLYIGEKVGTGKGPALDIAVDPIEGTTPAANAQDNSMAVLAVTPKDTMLHAPDMYMKKMIVGAEAKGKIDMNAPIEENLEALAKAKNKKIEDLRIIVQDRSRHRDLIKRIRATGAKVELFMDGDVIYSLATCIDALDADMLYGIGGAPEGVITAVAVKILGGDMQAQLQVQNEEQFTRCQMMGLKDPSRILKIDDMIQTDDCMFIATGITNSPILRKVDTYTRKHTETESLLINGWDKKLQYVKTVHDIV